MTIYLVCEIHKWIPRAGEIAPLGTSVTNEILHKPLKGFYREESAKDFIRKIVEDSQGRKLRHDFDLFEIPMEKKKKNFMLEAEIKDIEAEISMIKELGSFQKGKG